MWCRYAGAPSRLDAADPGWALARRTRTNSWLRTTAAPVVNRNVVEAGMRADRRHQARDMQGARALAGDLDVVDLRRVADLELERRIDLILEGLAGPTWLSTSIARAPVSITTRSGRISRPAPCPHSRTRDGAAARARRRSATWTTAPSPMNAVFGATTTSAVVASCPDARVADRRRRAAAPSSRW